MFIGEYTISMDAKGRIAVPAKFRNLLNAAAVVTRGLDKSLFLYPRSEWEAIAGKLAALPLSKANSRAFSTLMLTVSSDVTLDKHYPCIIPKHFRTFAA